MVKQRYFIIICSIICVLAIVITVVNILRYLRPFTPVNIMERNTLGYLEEEEIIDVNNMTPTNIEISPKTIDFGTVGADSILTAKFFVINTGSEMLIIQSLNADCICTSAVIDKIAATPGDSIVVTLTMNTKGKEGDNNVYASFMANTKEVEHKLRLRVRVEN